MPGVEGPGVPLQASHFPGGPPLPEHEQPRAGSLRSLCSDRRALSAPRGAWHPGSELAHTGVTERTHFILWPGKDV